MDFQRMTLVNIYGDIRNYLTGVEGFSEEFTISCVKAHLDIYEGNLKRLATITSNIEKQGGEEARGLFSSLLGGLAGIEVSETEEEKPKKKRGRPKKSKENNVEVA